MHLSPKSLKIDLSQEKKESIHYVATVIRRSKYSIKSPHLSTTIDLQGYPIAPKYSNLFTYPSSQKTENVTALSWRVFHSVERSFLEGRILAWFAVHQRSRFNKSQIGAALISNVFKNFPIILLDLAILDFNGKSHFVCLLYWLIW